MAIDLDRGVTMRQIVAFNDPKNPRKYEPDLNYGGMAVYMYKDDPGKYYDAHGHPIPEAIAARSGFPIDKHAKARKRKERLEALTEQFKEELSAEERDDVVILAEAGEWQVIELPNNRAKVIDRETGRSVTPVPLPISAAKTLLKELTAMTEPATVEASTPAKGVK